MQTSPCLISSLDLSKFALTPCAILSFEVNLEGLRWILETFHGVVKWFGFSYGFFLYFIIFFFFHFFPFFLLFFVIFFFCLFFFFYQDVGCQETMKFFSLNSQPCISSSLSVFLTHLISTFVKDPSLI